MLSFKTLLLVAFLPCSLRAQDCSNGKVYSECGSPCTLTCANYNSPPICLTVCATGCFCPDGTVEYNNQCVSPSECPVTTPPPSTPPSTPVCPEGKIYSTCGSPCPLNCDHPHNNPCTFNCAEGCFCAKGTVELGDICVAPEDCPDQVLTTTEMPTACTNGKEYRDCGPVCTETCNTKYGAQTNPCFSLRCFPGCFCPEGTVEHEGQCIRDQYCPNYPCQGFQCPDNFHCELEESSLEPTCTRSLNVPSTTPPPPSTHRTPPPTPPSTSPPAPVCPEGKIYSTCGSPCPLNCDHPHDNPCTFNCAEGCFCAKGTVELGDICVAPEDCPVPSTTPPPPSTHRTPPPTPPSTSPPAPVCPEGKIYSTCGSPCPLNCDHPHDNPCTFNCAEGCFCAKGTVELGDICVAPEDCPGQVLTTTEMPTACTNGKEYRDCGPVCTETCNTKYGAQTNPCFSLRCFPGCFCPEGTVEHEGQCIRDQYCPNYPCQGFKCPDDFHCELEQTSLEPRCMRSLYVPCTADVPLACDSEFLRCVVENTTRHATCLPSCFLDNGNCNYEQTCVVAKADHGSTIHCLNPKELPQECPAGMVVNECGSLCQETCDDVLKNGVKICPLVCGPPDCTCPIGLVRYRDRCVDPKECYSLKLYPPALNPLPTVRTDVALIKLTPTDRSVTKSDFSDIQDHFLNSLEQLLSDHAGVKAELHAVLENDGGLEVYVMLSGGDVSAESVQSYIDTITAGHLALPIDDNIVIVDLPQVNTPAHDSTYWTIVGISVGAVSLLVLILLLVTLSACCCICIKRKQTKKSTEYLPVPPTYSQLVNEGMGYVAEKKYHS